MDKNERRAYENLANAIILQAVHDYRIGYDTYSCERFFTGEWIQMLSKIDGTKLLNYLRKEKLENGNK